jgi:hypothetical protein
MTVLGGEEEHTDITSFLQVLTQVVTPGAAMLVNVDNVHWKYCTFRGRSVFSVHDMQEYVDRLMAEETDED